VALFFFSPLKCTREAPGRGPSRARASTACPPRLFVLPPAAPEGRRSARAVSILIVLAIRTAQYGFARRAELRPPFARPRASPVLAIIEPCRPCPISTKAHLPACTEGAPGESCYGDPRPVWKRPFRSEADPRPWLVPSSARRSRPAGPAEERFLQWAPARGT